MEHAFMKKFLFITHLTPKKYRSALREKLMEVMQAALAGQQYPEWKALWIGEEESVKGNIKTVKANNDSKEEHSKSLNEIYLRTDVKEFIEDCDYVSKLDDDDLISSHCLERAATLDFDCYFDLHHAFYDITSGSITQQKRNWIPSTAIHKKEHAFKDLSSGKMSDNLLNSLLYDHHANAWIAYYKNLRIINPAAKEPVYLRVLSPTSRTAGVPVTPATTVADIKLESYQAYLKQFGNWRSAHITGFENYMPALDKLWPAFSGKPLGSLPPATFSEKLKGLFGFSK